MGDINYSDYELVWEDNFDGNKLNRDDWNVELHEPGWVNEEWQEYIDSEEVVCVKDGKLHLIPVKKDNGDGTFYYASGRVSTQYKRDFVYGMFETYAKVPLGKGYLPAFWLMATNEEDFGYWPCCGEIDIMEILGDHTDSIHGTIHYGNPHEQNQGSYTLPDGNTFDQDFHKFTCIWEPGKIQWFVDDILYHEVNLTLDVTTSFDHEFYIILNLAIGGNWVGYPDENTKFENNPFIIDYVKVYKKK